MESIPYNLSFLYAVMEQETPHQCPQNVIYIQVGNGHGSIYCMAAGKYLLLVGIGRACAPVRCAHPSFWAH